MDDDFADLPMGKLVTIEERELPPELSAEEIAEYRRPERNPGNVERERLAELAIARREGRA